MLEPNAGAGQSDRERFRMILAVQRAAYLRDGAPSLLERRSDLKRFRAALIARRRAIEEAVNADFGNRSRHETALMEVLGVVQGIDYLERNLGRFMRGDGEQLSKITSLIEPGAIRPVVDRIFPFHATHESMDYLVTGRARGKVVIKVR